MTIVTAPTVQTVLEELLFDVVIKVDRTQVPEKAFGSFRVADLSFELCISMQDLHLGVPMISLTNKYPLPHNLPHVSETICYQRGSGLVLDRHEPLVVLKVCVAQAIDIVRQGITGDNHNDFLEEFVPHWLKAATECREVYSMVNSRRGIHKILAIYDAHGKNRELKAFADAEQPILSLGTKVVGVKPKVLPGILVHLELSPSPEAMLALPERWTVKRLNSFIFDHLHSKQRRQLQRLQKQHPYAPMMFVVPRGNGTVAQVGLDFVGRKSVEALDINNTQVPRFLSLNRLDRQFLLPRGNGDLNLANKRVLLIGCGSVGSRVAELLASSGVGHLTLVDPDRFEHNNLHRHILNAHDLGNSKVQALGKNLKLRFPQLDCIPIAKTFRNAALKLEGFDLLISATGEPMVELELNQRLYHAKSLSPGLYTWLEPMGIGGHAVVVFPEQQGCLECLYTQTKTSETLDEDLTPLYCRLSYAAYYTMQPKDFFQNLDGCGGVFTPFSSLDSVRTAELAVRLALEVILGTQRKTFAMSWKGDPTNITSQGYSTSQRIHTPQTVLSGNEFGVKNCPCCLGMGLPSND